MQHRPTNPRQRSALCFLCLLSLLLHCGCWSCCESELGYFSCELSIVTVVVIVVTMRLVPVSACWPPREGSAALEAVVRTIVVIYMEVNGRGLPLPSNSMQPFSEHAVPFEQQPPPTTAVPQNLMRDIWVALLGKLDIQHRKPWYCSKK
jgi:hypothetical protein